MIQRFLINFTGGAHAAKREDVMDKLWLGFWMVLASTIVIITLGMTFGYYAHVNAMASKGFHKVTVMGSGFPEWQKVGEEER